jgi:hypothetical protein
MERKLPKYKLLLVAIIIAIISFLDFQYFGRHAYRPDIPAAAIGVIQLIGLLVILWLGRWVWSDTAGIRKVWTYSYIAVTLLCAAIGVLVLLFPKGGSIAATTVGFIRPFFASPMPLLISYLIFKVQNGNWMGSS